MRDNASKWNFIADTLASTLQDQIHSSDLDNRIMTLDELQAMYDGHLQSSYKGEGFYRVAGKVYDGGEVVRITNNKKGGYNIWCPTPISVLKEGLEEVVKNIKSDVWGDKLSGLLERKKSDDSFDLNSAIEELENNSIREYKLIEPGCGDARATLAANMIYSMKGVAIDIDPKMIDIANTNLFRLFNSGMGSVKDVKLLEGNILDKKLIESTLNSTKHGKSILFLYLTRPNTIQTVSSFLPYMTMGDYILTNRVPLQDQLPKDLSDRLETKLEPPRWMMVSPINLYKVTK